VLGGVGVDVGLGPVGERVDLGLPVRVGLDGAEAQALAALKRLRPVIQASKPPSARSSGSTLRM
jgi:hypothetical protein